MRETHDLVAPLPTPPAPSIPDVIQRYCNGEDLKAIADDYRVTTRTLYRWMLGSQGDQYPELKEQALIARIAESDIELEEANSSVTVARAHALSRLKRQDFERRCPKLYGPKQELNIDQQTRIIIQRALTPLPVDITPQQPETKEQTSINTTT